MTPGTIDVGVPSSLEPLGLGECHITTFWLLLYMGDFHYLRVLFFGSLHEGSDYFESMLCAPDSSNAHMGPFKTDKVKQSQIQGLGAVMGRGRLMFPQTITMIPKIIRALWTPRLT